MGEELGGARCMIGKGTKQKAFLGHGVCGVPALHFSVVSVLVYEYGVFSMSIFLNYKRLFSCQKFKTLGTSYVWTQAP